MANNSGLPPSTAYHRLPMRLLNAMQAWLVQNKQHKHGAHVYRIEDFGLTPALVEQRLAYYRDKYQIPLETQKF